MAVKMNLGSGPDIKEGWVNVDRVVLDQVEYWDMVSGEIPELWIEHFDFILINHVLCTMRPSDASLVIHKAKKMLKPSGVLQVVDVDMDKAIAVLQNGQLDLLPTPGRTIDEQFLMHVSGYGTRLSLYTNIYLKDLLISHGFGNVHSLYHSEYDSRPLESLVVEGTK